MSNRVYMPGAHVDPFHPCLPCIVIVATTPPPGASRVARGDEARIEIRCGNCGTDECPGTEISLAELDAWIQNHCGEEPAAFVHSDMCEDSRPDVSHLRASLAGPACRCACAKCSDRDGYCVCPQCSRPDSHLHREAS